MYFRINATNYTAIDNLSFSPEADLINDSLPINEFEARIFTNDDIAFGQWADLYDDRNNLYAHFWLRFAERIGRDDDRQTYIVRIIGQSPLAFLERVTMPAEMVDDDAWVLIMNILDYLGSLGQDGDIISSNDIDDEVGDVHVTGFCPEQSARERLQWILTAAGGYALSAFNDVIVVNPVPLGNNAQVTTIPPEKTFWKPTVSYRDYVTKIKVTGYTYTQGTPESTDEYVTDGSEYWIVQKQVVTLSNSGVPSGAPNNEIIVDGMTILTPARAAIVAGILANYYFNRCEVEADVINNYDYEPGMKVMVHTDLDVAYGGYVTRCDFSFGLQARSTLHIIGTYNVDIVTLTVNYMWGTITVATRTYQLPKNMQYSITTEYIDSTIGGHRYIFRPTTATISGTLTGNKTETVNVEIALDYYQSNSSTRSSIKTKMNTVLDEIQSIFNKEVKAIKKAYKGKSAKAKKKRDKYITQAEKERHNKLKAHEKALTKMLSGATNTAQILYIVSVDDVAEDSEVVQEGTVVVIDNGSSEEEPVIVPPVGYDDDPYQGGGDEEEPEYVNLTSIEVTTMPTKTMYAYGETLDLTGLVVTAHYSDNTTEIITDESTYSPANGSVLNNTGIRSVSISHTENAITKTTSFNITVAEYVPVTSIPNNAYENSTITSYFGSTIITIGNEAFKSCANLSIVSFPVCTTVGDDAFAMCGSLSSISFPSCVTIGNGAFMSCFALQEVNLPQLSYIPSYAFAYCSSLTVASFPNATSIGSRPFWGCSSLSSISVPNLQTISAGAFGGISQITHLDLPELVEVKQEGLRDTHLITVSVPKLKSIGVYGFSAMLSLSAISLPNLEYMGLGAFAECVKLSQVYLMGSSVASCGSSPFYQTPIQYSEFLGYFGSIYVPMSLVDAYKSANNWSKYSSRITGV